MPYRRPYRKTYKRRPRRYAKRKSTWGSTAYKALRIATKVASIVNAELKYDDTEATATCSTSWQLVPLTQIGEGDDDTNRDGRSILSKSLYGNIKVKPNLGATSPTCVCCCIVKDKWQAGTTPAGTDVFETNDPDSLRNITADATRFQILWKRRFFLTNALDGGTGAVLAGSNFKFSKFFIRTNFHIKYLGTTDAAASNGRNNLYLMFINDNSTTNASIEYQFRHRFYDN